MKKIAREITKLEDVEAGQRVLYEPKEGGGFKLLPQALSRIVEAENEHLIDERNRELVIKSVRDALVAAGTKPRLLEAAAALFIQQHRFAVRENEGRLNVVVVGKKGVADPAAAALQFMEAEDAKAAFTDLDSGKRNLDFEDDPDSFTARIRELH